MIDRKSALLGIGRFAVVLIALLCALQLCAVLTNAEIFDGTRIKGDDEPRIVSWRVLEGVTEPFESQQKHDIPAWKQLKIAADQKAAGMMMQQALHEYGQLLRHPYMFGEMPMEEKYDVFLSMSKLLKIMGFHQRAELILYEAMSYTTRPYEAHLQLALLFLDKEDLEQAKVHLKNCLFFEENDTLILSHLAVVLISEGKMHEAKFFISRILTNLEARVKKLSFLLSEQEMKKLAGDMDYRVFSAWVEDLLVKVYYGEFRITPSATVDLYRFFSNLYKWVKTGDLSGRFIFDIGQSLYEGGRPKVGRMMMRRGYETSNATEEGVVSTEIVNLRLALDYSVIPDTMADIVESYLNMTSFLSVTSDSYIAVDIENIMDVYWPLPLLWWSSLPVSPIMQELLWRFDGGPARADDVSKYWLEPTHDEVLDDFYDASLVRPSGARYLPYSASGYAATTATNIDADSTMVSSDGTTTATTSTSTHAASNKKSKKKQKKRKNHNKISSGDGSSLSVGAKLHVGVLGGHMNNHPVGHMVFRKLLGLNSRRNESMRATGYFATGTSSGSSSSSSSGRQGSSVKEEDEEEEFNRIYLTLLALPLVSDHITKSIAAGVDNIVNLPMDTNKAWKSIERLHLDVLIFPDWQPFPDQQSLFFQSRRIAPVQVCLYVRGSSCVSNVIDYYLMPEEMEQQYLNSIPAADIDARTNSKGMVYSAAVASSKSSSSSSSLAQGGGALSAGGKTEESTRHCVSDNDCKDNENNNIDDGNNDNDTIHNNSSSSSSSSRLKQSRRPVRPLWKEGATEQVVLLDWPIMTPSLIVDVANSVHAQQAAETRRASKGSGTGGSGGATNIADGARQQEVLNQVGTVNTQTAADFQLQGSEYSNQFFLDMSASSTSMSFSPLEVEGKIFFEDQPVAVMPLYPTSMHPLMDDTIFKIMRSVPSLHLVFALPDSFLTHTQDPKHKVSWARKLVRRLWSKGGNLYHRIRLLPVPIKEHRLLQLLRQADMVLDSFPVGCPFHILSLAASVGTPVITMRSGTTFRTPREELKNIRSRIMQQQHHHKAYIGNPLAQQLMANVDIPWSPSISAIAGFYRQIGLENELVANNTHEYFKLATALATDREFAYGVRVHLLEAVDQGGHKLQQQQEQQQEQQQQAAGGSQWEENRHGDRDTPLVDCSACTNDLRRFLLRVGMPWALARVQAEADVARGLAASVPAGQHGKKGQRRPAQAFAASGADDDDFSPGVILQ